MLFSRPLFGKDLGKILYFDLQIPAFHVPCFTDSGFSCSWFYRFRLFMFWVLQIPAFHVPCFTYSGLSCSLFYRFRLFMFLILQIPASHVPGFLVPCSVPHSVPRFHVPCFTNSHQFYEFGADSLSKRTVNVNKAYNVGWIACLHDPLRYYRVYKEKLKKFEFFSTPYREDRGTKYLICIDYMGTYNVE